MPLLGTQSAALHDTIVLTHRAASRMKLHAGATTLGCQSTCAARSNSSTATGRPHWRLECFAYCPPRNCFSCRHQHTHMHAGTCPARCAPALCAQLKRTHCSWLDCVHCSRLRLLIHCRLALLSCAQRAAAAGCQHVGFALHCTAGFCLQLLNHCCLALLSCRDCEQD